MCGPYWCICFWFNPVFLLQQRAARFQSEHIWFHSVTVSGSAVTWSIYSEPHPHLCAVRVDLQPSFLLRAAHRPTETTCLWFSFCMMIREKRWGLPSLTHGVDPRGETWETQEKERRRTNQRQTRWVDCEFQLKRFREQQEKSNDREECVVWEQSLDPPGFCAVSRLLGRTQVGFGQNTARCWCRKGAAASCVHFYINVSARHWSNRSGGSQARLWVDLQLITSSMSSSLGESCHLKVRLCITVKRKLRFALNQQLERVPVSAQEQERAPGTKTPSRWSEKVLFTSKITPPPWSHP